MHRLISQLDECVTIAVHDAYAYDLLLVFNNVTLWSVDLIEGLNCWNML